jgi:hypothetical protein
MDWREVKTRMAWDGVCCEDTLRLALATQPFRRDTP